MFWPASKLTSQVVRHRRQQFLASSPSILSLPVVVVGNLTVGGTGKTPLIIYLIEQLRARGLRVGVVSRGYGGIGPYPLRVTRETSAHEAGDEPVMIVRRTGVPLVVDTQRVRGAAWLADTEKLDIMLSDDGLQHYRLPRQLEIVVIDGERGFGNGNLLPMGPLREPLERLASIPFAVINGEPGTKLKAQLARFPHLACFKMDIKPSQWRKLGSSLPVDVPFKPDDRVVALAGIGNPARFFQTLNTLEIAHQPLVFPDHHCFSEQDLLVIQTSKVVMTEKDSVKIRPEWLPDAWYLPVDADITGTLADDILRALTI